MNADFLWRTLRDLNLEFLDRSREDRHTILGPEGCLYLRCGSFVSTPDSPLWSNSEDRDARNTRKTLMRILNTDGFVVDGIPNLPTDERKLADLSDAIFERYTSEFLNPTLATMCRFITDTLDPYLERMDCEEHISETEMSLSSAYGSICVQSMINSMHSAGFLNADKIKGWPFPVYRLSLFGFRCLTENPDSIFFSARYKVYPDYIEL